MRSIITSLAIFLVATSTLNAQNIGLAFDGQNDFVNLGTSAANNARTMEFWFQLSNDVDQNLQTEIWLVGTEIPFPSVNEWHFTLTQAGTSNPAGTLRFVYVTSQGQVSQVYSDNTSWQAGEWYHAAVVIDPNFGLQMYVDGQLQSTTVASFINPIFDNGADVEIGRHFGRVRFFDGVMDDLRFSSGVLYTSNFTPPCPDVATEPFTVGLWNFNDNSGNVLTDSSSFGNDGIISGATWTNAQICSASIEDQVQLNLEIFPNPTNGIITVAGDFEVNNDLNFDLYDVNGKIVSANTLNSNSNEFDLNYLDSGIYYFTVQSSESILQTGKIIIF